jgi:hypothetical protein
MNLRKLASWKLMAKKSASYYAGKIIFFKIAIKQTPALNQEVLINPGIFLLMISW